MKKISPMLVLAALVLGLCALSACGGSSSSPVVAPTATASPAPVVSTSPGPTQTSAAFTANFTVVPFLPTTFLNTSVQSAGTLTFPGPGTNFNVTIQVSGGLPPFTATQSNTAVTCASVAATSNNQFVITPNTAAGGAACGPSQITFSDSSPTKQTTILTYFVNVGATNGITAHDRSNGE